MSPQERQAIRMHVMQGTAQSYQRRYDAIVACVRSIDRLLELVREDDEQNDYDGWLDPADQWHDEGER